MGYRSTVTITGYEPDGTGGTWTRTGYVSGGARDDGPKAWNPVIGDNDEDDYSGDDYLTIDFPSMILPSTFDRITYMNISSIASTNEEYCNCKYYYRHTGGGTYPNQYTLLWDWRDIAVLGNGTEHVDTYTYTPYFTGFGEKHLSGTWYRDHWVSASARGGYFRLVCYATDLPEIQEIYLNEIRLGFTYIPIENMYTEASVGTYDTNGSYTITATRATSSTERNYMNAYQIFESVDDGSNYTAIITEYTDTNYTKTRTQSSSNRYFYKGRIRNNGNDWGASSGTAFTGYPTDSIYCCVPVSGFTATLNEASSRVDLSWNSQTYDYKSYVNYKIYYKGWEEGTSEPGSWSHLRTVGWTSAPTGTRSTNTTGYMTLNNNYKYIFKIRTYLNNAYESVDSGDIKFVYYLKDAPVMTDLDTGDTSSGIPQVEDEYEVNLEWVALDDASYGANATKQPVNYNLTVYYHPTDDTPDSVLSSDKYNVTWEDRAAGSSWANVDVSPNGNGYYKFKLTYDQEHTAYYSTQNYSNGGVDKNSNTPYIRVAYGWQGIINEKTNPDSIGGKHFLTIGGTVGGVDDGNLNPDGDPVY